VNLVVGAPLWLIALLALALLAAAVEDAVRLRISNLTCAVVLVGAIISMVLHGFSLVLWQNLVVCVAILVVGMPAFAAGWLGGGDVKLLAVLGLWLNLEAALGFVAAVFIAGGVIAILYIATRLFRRGLPEGRSSRRVPYGLAIVAGAVWVFGAQLSQPRVNPLADYRSSHWPV
jgi:prepilin peptidase CpaA